jgi:pimeloyl-ACP methyl ester carboxylesterase
MLGGPLGPLAAWYFPGRGSTFVIGVHGQNGSRNDLLRVVGIVHRMGLPALDVTYRNDYGVAGGPSGYLRYGTNYLGNTGWLKVPALVTHGGDDTTVPMATSTWLKAAKPALVTFAVFPGAGHVESWSINRARYTALLESLLTPAAP